ncbi:hypothetical protein F2P81_012114 [Scophthalmus maximus]|uniref:Myb/SANT-like DNA-binding domain-containing protein n=1 Tax=Scophthalmus maximus TaxID=52904 RepID=A0A6A4T3Q7_SCOMX|nr:hypothetical protein F2P81_012114 [Scophthalmus maximus]
MHNWQENEIKELLTIRGSEAIRFQITGTVKDSVVYSRITKRLAERGVFRSHMQVISKLKALRKQYLKYHQQKLRCGSDRVDWPFYEQCHRVFGNASMAHSVKQQSPSPPPVASPPPPSPSPPPPPPTPPPPPPPPASALSDEHHEVVVGLWDEVDKHLGPVEPEDDDDQYSPAEQLHTMNTPEPAVTTRPDRGPEQLQGQLSTQFTVVVAEPGVYISCRSSTSTESYELLWQEQSHQGKTYKVPTKKRKTTVMDQVSALVSATVAQLREMDAAMQAQEDARLQRLMDHEKEMQNNLMSQLVTMHERTSRENHDRQRELVDKILSRFPSPSAPSGH